MEQIAKWTTPTITYKPSSVDVSDIENAYLCIKQYAKIIIEKDIDDADVDEDSISWTLSQEDTGKLSEGKECVAGVDWVTIDGTRGRSNIGKYLVVGSGKDEVIDE